MSKTTFFAAVAAIIFLVMTPISVGWIGIDTVPPATTITYAPISPNGNANWYVTDVNITLSCTDATSGCDYVNFSFTPATAPSPGAWTLVPLGGAAANSTNFNFTHKTTTQGNKTLWYFSADVAGNNETVKKVKLAVDTLAPNSTLILNGTVGVENWFKSPVTVNITCVDNIDGSGCTASSPLWCNTTEICIPDTTFTTPFNITKENTTYLRLRSQDIAGNNETIKSEFIKIDYTLPEAVCVNCDAPDPTNSSTYITFPTNVSDSISGVSSTRICRDSKCDYFFCKNDTTVEGGTGFTARPCSYLTRSCEEDSGSHSYWVSVVDKAGNVFIDSSASGTFYVKKADGCPCSEVGECAGGQCTDGTCITPAGPSINLSSMAVLAEPGSEMNLLLTIKNQLPIEDTVELHLDGGGLPNKKIQFWSTWPGKERGDPDTSLELEKNEEQMISLKIYAGQAGTYSLRIWLQSQKTGLRGETNVAVAIVPSGAVGPLGQTPDLNIFGLILLVILAPLILFKLA